MPFDYVRSNIWDIGMNGPWNEESSIKQVTNKVGHPTLLGDAAREKAEQARNKGEFEQQVLERAERFRNILCRQDQDGDGRLSFEEFNRGLMELGVRLPEGEIKAIWGQEAASPWTRMESEKLKKSPARDPPLQPGSAATPRRPDYSSSAYTGSLLNLEHEEAGAVTPSGTPGEPARAPSAGASAAVGPADPLSPGRPAAERAAASAAGSRKQGGAPSTDAGEAFRRERSAEESRRWLLHRRVHRKLAHRATDLRRAFETQDAAARGALDFGGLQQCLRGCGVKLSDQDMQSLWAELDQGGSVQRPGEVAAVALAGEVSLDSLARALVSPDAGDRAAPREGDSELEKVQRLGRKAGLVWGKLALQVRHRRHTLAHAFEIADALGEGRLRYGEFRECLRGAGLLCGEEDCRAMLAACGAAVDAPGPQAQGLLVDYGVFLHNVSERSAGARESARLFKDKEFDPPAVPRTLGQPETEGNVLVREGLRGEALAPFPAGVHHHAPPPSLWHPPRLAPTASADAPAGDAGTEGEGRAGAPPAGAQYVPVPPWEQDTPPAAQAGADGTLLLDQSPPRAARATREGLFLAKLAPRLADAVPRLRALLTRPGEALPVVALPALSAALAQAGIRLDAADAAAVLARVRVSPEGHVDLSRLLPAGEQAGGADAAAHFGPPGPVELGTARRQLGTAGALQSAAALSAPASPRARRHGGTDAWGVAEPRDAAARAGGGGTEEGEVGREAAALAASVAERVSACKAGNPLRLRSMFRRYDTARRQRVSAAEFAQVMLDCNSDVTRAEAEALAHSLSAGDGSIAYAAFVDQVKQAARGGEGGGAGGRGKMAFGARVEEGGRATWIEATVSHAMRDSARFERARCAARARPASGRTIPLHLRAPPPRPGPF